MGQVLLVYANPAITATPIPPVGMERVAQVLQLAGCDVELCAPFIESDPLEALTTRLGARDWDLVGFSVRNLDDALVVRQVDGDTPFDLTFYGDAVRPLVAAAVAAVGSERVLIGGPALSTAGRPLLEFLGARVGIMGPADDLVWHLGKELAAGKGLVLGDDPRIVRVDALAALPHQTLQPERYTQSIELFPAPARRMGPYLGLTLDRGGRVPVAVASGCNRRCQFCVEARFAGRQVLHRPVEAVAIEVRQLKALGATRFWLATSEINVPDESYAIALLQALAPLEVDLAFFIQPAPVSDALLDAIEAAGVDPSALSFEFGHFDESLLRAGAGPANLRQIEALVELWLRRGYRTLGGSALFGAHPLETWESLERATRTIRDIDAALPEGLGLAYATGARVYPNSPLADAIGSDPSLHADLYGEPDLSFVRPVVFSRPASPRDLLAHMQSALASCRGPMGPMNAEAPASEAILATEALVSRGIFRRHQDRPEEAAELFEAALERDPEHLEALAQLSMVAANELNRPDRARMALSRLMGLLRAGDPRLASVEIALNRLTAGE